MTITKEVAHSHATTAAMRLRGRSGGDGTGEDDVPGFNKSAKQGFAHGKTDRDRHVISENRQAQQQRRIP